MGKSQLYEIYVATNKHPPDPLWVDSNKINMFFLRQGLTYDFCNRCDVFISLCGCPKSNSCSNKIYESFASTAEAFRKGLVSSTIITNTKFFS